MEKQEVDYENLDFEGDLEDFEHLYYFRLSLYYEDSVQRRFKILDAESYLINADIFSRQTKQELQIF